VKAAKKHHSWQYTDVFIIYNPHSTGASESNAKELAKELEDIPAAIKVHVIPTEYSGHGEQLAYELAMTGKKPLIISSSGDGGYHEVVNGALRAQAEGADPTCGLLPSGNANDHYHNLHRQPIAQQILNGGHQYIDILQIKGRSDGRPWQRYAHSYIGIGLTPKVAAELNKVKLNRMREIQIVLRSISKLRASRLVVNGEERAYDSLIFSNVGRMSKVLSLSDTAKLTDGKFEVISFRSRGRFHLWRQLFMATTVGLHATRRADYFKFATLRRVRVQLDGELFRLDGLSSVEISLEPRILRCII
jgi:diacylglycerol kinase family enzyme